MRLNEIAPGVKFHDERLTSQPKEYRIHIVRTVDLDAFTAEHVASGNVRRFGMNEEVTAPLRRVPPVLLRADLDDLIGEKVRIWLSDGGNLGGRITAIRYHDVDIAGMPSREVASIEIDRSGATSYPMRDISRIDRVQA